MKATRLGRILILFLCVFAGTSSPATACLWDRDTLATEAKGIPDVVNVIIGWFDRNPPLFYEMRLQRVTGVLAREPNNLDAYDDAGVACDRLGRDDEAIGWMEKKRAVLDTMDAASPSVRDHRYRYFANVGTFWVHRWFRAGADRTNLVDVKTARDFIAKAIALNPDAHFGREKYQLKIMDWIIKPAAWNPESEAGRQWGMPDCIGLVEAAQKAGKTKWELDTTTLKTLGYSDAERGLTGLIVLGNAWESVDVYYALHSVLSIERKPTVDWLARLRMEELLQGGRRFMQPPPDDQLGRGLFTIPQDQNLIDQYFKDARAASNARNTARETYMLARLKTGRHPDTDASFWSDWDEPRPPSLPGWWARFISTGWKNPITYYGDDMIEILVSSAFAALFYKIWSDRRRKKGKRSAALNSVR